MYSIIDRLRRLMDGRYGMDPLGSLLLIAFVFFNYLIRFALNTLLKRGLIPAAWWVTLLRFLPAAILVWAVWRMLSRNIPARCAENSVYVGWSSRLRRWMTQQRQRVESSKTHRQYRCPQCSQQLRVPRGRGKIAIRCPKCGAEFIKKT